MKEPTLEDFRPKCGCREPNLLQYIVALKNYIKYLKKQTNYESKEDEKS